MVKKGDQENTRYGFLHHIWCCSGLDLSGKYSPYFSRVETHLQTDGEHKEDHTEFCDMLQALYIYGCDGSRGMGPKDDAGDYETQYGTKTKTLKEYDAA